jgi:hypothetical protein
MPNTDPDCIVLLCQKCKRVVMAQANEDSHLAAKDKTKIGRLVAAGRIAQHAPASAVRKMGFGCKCKERGT